MTMNGAVHAGARQLHRRRRGAGRAAGASSPAPSRTTSSRSSWCATPTSIRPSPSMRIVADIIEYTAKHMPKFNSISISGYHMQEAGATAVQELAFTLADGLEYVRAALAQGPRRRRVRAAAVVLLRHRHELLHGGREAARRAPAVVADHDRASAPKKPRSLMLRTHCQTSGVSLHRAGPVQQHRPHRRTRRWRRCSAARRSLHTNSLRRGDRAADRILGPHRAQHAAHPAARDRRHPRRRSARRLLLRRGADRKRSPTQARALIDEVEALGGMTKAVEAGMPKLRIEEAAARRQARVDRGEEVIVGVNKYRLERRRRRSTSATSTTRRCATQQIARLERDAGATRDPAKRRGGARRR